MLEATVFELISWKSNFAHLTVRKAANTALKICEELMLRKDDELYILDEVYGKHILFKRRWCTLKFGIGRLNSFFLNYKVGYRLNIHLVGDIRRWRKSSTHWFRGVWNMASFTFTSASNRSSSSWPANRPTAMTTKHFNHEQSQWTTYGSTFTSLWWPTVSVSGFSSVNSWFFTATKLRGQLWASIGNVTKRSDSVGENF